MTNPHEEFGLPPTATEAEIRARYLELVRAFPPDRAPEKFAAIRAAYDELRDPLRHLERQLFYLGTTDSFDSLAADLRQRLRTARIPFESLLALADVP